MLCSDPEDREAWAVAVLRGQAPRGGSRIVWEDLAEGTRAEVGLPRNDLPLENAAYYVLVAGGIEITPLLPMGRRLAFQGADWKLVYCGRRRNSMAFAAELKDGLGDWCHLVPEDECGLIDLPAVLADPDVGAAVYVCGPESLITAVERATETRRPDALHSKRFVA